jgi:hypothetical protein
MARRAVLLAGWVAVGVVLASGTAARAGSVGKIPVADIAKYATRLGKQAAPYLELVALADQVTTREGVTKVRAGKPALESLRLDARFRLPVEVENYVTNAVLFAEVPGRRVAVRLRVDCLVYCSLDLSGFRVERDRDYPDTVVIRLPEFEVEAAPAAVVAADCRIDYGRLRTRWLDSDKAGALREKLLKAAREKAAEEFRATALPAYRQEFANQLQRQLRARFPTLRIHVR